MIGNMQNSSENIDKIEAKIGYHFKDSILLQLAFVHRSYVNEHPEVSEHNERLEFLGDSVLGLVVADYLYNKFPEMPEGDLSTLKSRLVEATACVGYIEKLDVESFVLLGRGEKLNPGRGRLTILADLFEAIVGAVFLDGGLKSVKTFYFNCFSDEIDEILNTPPQNWKALLQDFCQKNYGKTPDYEVLEETGPDHKKTFKIAVIVDGKKEGIGAGTSKKEAQANAAKEALIKLQPELFSS